MYITEPEKKLPIAEEFDVLVAGGGVAGMAAALAAAEKGAKVCLCEKEFALGGLATLGLVVYYLPICDGEGTQVSFSIAEELLKLSIKHGNYDISKNPWLSGGSDEDKKKKRYVCDYNPYMFAYLAEELLVKAGVRIFYGASVCATQVSDGKIEYVILESKSGRQAVKVKSVVDATGDADVCVFAGEDTQKYSKGNMQAAWYYSVQNGKNKLRMQGALDKPIEGSDEVKPFDYPNFSGLDAWENSNIAIDAHSRILSDFLKHKADNAENELTIVPTILQVRMTRRLVGASEIKKEQMFTHFENSVGMIANWRKNGEVYEIPFDCLHGKKVKNLITAGRCISADDEMWDLTRVIPACAVTGQAAGTAAAITDDFTNIDIKELQAALSNRGVKLCLGDVYAKFAK